MSIAITVVSGFTIVGFLLSRALKRNDIADVLWGLGFIAMALSYGVHANSFHSMAVLVMVIVWGLRLSIYIGMRNLKKTEDKRYANWRKEWGVSEPLRAFLQVFLLQGVLMGLVSTSVIMSARSPERDLSPYDFVGLVLFIFGFLLEVIGDWQMAHFKSQKNSGPIRDGLWADSRHPNYFGEILVWWGFYFLAINSEWGVYTIVSPLIMTYLLTRVSGVPMLDELISKRGAEYKKYIETTSALLPIQFSKLFVTLFLMVALILLDGLWLGLAMKNFYALRLGTLLRDNWLEVVWAILFVYFFLAVGVQFFALRNSKLRSEAAFKGAVLGLCVYGVYDFTNLALLKNWSSEVAFADVVWGTFLCSMASALSFSLNQRGKV